MCSLNRQQIASRKAFGMFYERWAWFTVCIIWAVAFCFSAGLVITMLVNRFTGDEANTLVTIPRQSRRQSRGASLGRLEMLPDTGPLPHLICSRLIFGSGGGDEAGRHGDGR